MGNGIRKASLIFFPEAARQANVALDLIFCAPLWTSHLAWTNSSCLVKLVKGKSD
jgi:hypothetical protein